MQFSVEYADRPLNRLTSAFRIITVIPILIVAAIVAWFAILFTGRFPRGLVDYMVGVGR